MEPTLHGTNLRLGDRIGKSKAITDLTYEDLHNGHIDRCNTPEMTHCSSRSSSSSVVTACEHNCCAAPFFSDPESFQSKPEGLQHRSKAPVSYYNLRGSFGLSGRETYLAKGIKRCSATEECAPGSFASCTIVAYPSSISTESHSNCENLADRDDFLLKTDRLSDDLLLQDLTNLAQQQVNKIPRPTSITLHTSVDSAVMDDNSDSEDDEEDDDVDDDDDDDWSGEDYNLEASVLEALGHDFELAAHLIPRLHQIIYPEIALGVSSKVGSWRHAVTKFATGAESAADSGTTGSAKTPTSEAPTNNTVNEQRKRGRRQEADDESKEDDDDDEDGEERGSKRLKDMNSGSVSKHYWFACPFHKKCPSKYGQHGPGVKGKKGQYRTCAGPGFKSIQRLKEHLKRTHTPVQCERCYQIFEGGDRAARAADLENHRQRPDPCPRKSQSLKEGISEAQWVSLDEKRQKRNKGSPPEKPKTNVEKWNDIWVILFPDLPPPNSPWYDQSPTEPTSSFSRGGREFIQLFEIVLSHKIGQEHIRLEDGMQTRILDAARRAFEAWSTTTRWNSGSSSSFSVSVGSHLQSNGSQSLLGGSYHNISIPETGNGQKSLIAQSAELAQVPRYIKEMPHNSSMLPHSRTSLPDHTEPNMLARYVGGREASFPTNIADDMLTNGTPNTFTNTFSDGFGDFLQSSFNTDELTNNEWNFSSADSTANDSGVNFSSMPANTNQEWGPFCPSDFGHS